MFFNAKSINKIDIYFQKQLNLSAILTLSSKSNNYLQMFTRHMESLARKLSQFIINSVAYVMDRTLRIFFAVGFSCLCHKKFNSRNWNISLISLIAVFVSLKASKLQLNEVVQISFELKGNSRTFWWTHWHFNERTHTFK